MLKEDATLLNQLSDSLEETVKKMEMAYEEKDITEFNTLRKFFSQIQEQISETLK
jgi:hypothetical protein